jgi:hypothetical protein
MEHISTDNDFMIKTPTAQPFREMIDKMKLHQTKNFLHNKGSLH